MDKSNSLKYRKTIQTENGTIVINIRLNDECNNGHQDFAITADIYENGRWIAGGRCHDEILAIAPEFTQFVRLHLCDYNGAPMYAVANGFYHLRSGFNSVKPDHPDFQAQYCEYYRITPDQFKILDRCENKLQFSIALQSSGIIEQWKRDAQKGIETLESLTGVKFVNDSTRAQYTAPDQSEIDAENERIKSGYYSAKAKRDRAKQKEREIIASMRDKLRAEFRLAQIEFGLKSQVLRIGGKKALDNCIFYSHTKKLAFNWLSYDQLSEIEINRIVGKIKLPAGVTIEIKG